jgi:hypothetical protein
MEVKDVGILSLSKKYTRLVRGQRGTIMPNGDKTFLFVLYICSAEGAIKSETEAESTPVVPTYPKDPSAHKAPKTVPRDNKYPGGLSNVPPYT